MALLVIQDGYLNSDAVITAESLESATALCGTSKLLPAEPKWCAHAASVPVAAATVLPAAPIRQVLFDETHAAHHNACNE